MIPAIIIFLFLKAKLCIFCMRSNFRRQTILNKVYDFFFLLEIFGRKLFHFNLSKLKNKLTIRHWFERFKKNEKVKIFLKLPVAPLVTAKIDSRAIPIIFIFFKARFTTDFKIKINISYELNLSIYYAQVVKKFKLAPW